MRASSGNFPSHPLSKHLLRGYGPKKETIMSTSEIKRSRGRSKKITNDSDYICQRCKKIEFQRGIILSTTPISSWLINSHDDHCAFFNISKSIMSRTTYFASPVPNILIQHKPLHCSLFMPRINLEGIKATPWLYVGEQALMSDKDHLNASAYYFGCFAEFTSIRERTLEPYVNHIRPYEIPYDKIKYWMDECIRKHPGNCAKKTELPVHHLRLIDCKNRSIVDAKLGFRYSALSVGDFYSYYVLLLAIFCPSNWVKVHVWESGAYN